MSRPSLLLLVLVSFVGLAGCGAEIVDGEQAGNGGAITLDVERLLLAGTIDATVPGPFRGERGGDIHIEASKESFVSGAIRSSNAARIDVNVPVL